MNNATIPLIALYVLNRSPKLALMPCAKAVSAFSPPDRHGHHLDIRVSQDQCNEVGMTHLELASVLVCSILVAFSAQEGAKVHPYEMAMC